MSDYMGTILLATVEHVMSTGTLTEKRFALESLGRMAHTDDDTAEKIADMENRLRASILRDERPSKRFVA